MQDKRVALITGANQGVGLQVAKELVANGLSVLVGSRNFARGEAASKEIGSGAIALQLDVTDRVSIAVLDMMSQKFHCGCVFPAQHEIESIILRHQPRQRLELGNVRHRNRQEPPVFAYWLPPPF